MKTSKRSLALRALSKEQTEFSVDEAITGLKANASAKFDESIDCAIKLGIDPRQSNQIVRTTFVLPHGNGRMPKILVFAKGEKVAEAKAAGVDYVGLEDLIEKVQGGWCDFQVAIATPDCMRDVGRLGKILGPKKLLPSPKAGTVTNDIAKTVAEIRNGRVEIRNDSYGIIHLSIGRKSFSAEQIHDNFKALIEEILRAKPQVSKGRYIKSVTLAASMGPGYKVSAHEVSNNYRLV